MQVGRGWGGGASGDAAAEEPDGRVGPVAHRDELYRRESAGEPAEEDHRGAAQSGGLHPCRFLFQRGSGAHRPAGAHLQSHLSVAAQSILHQVYILKKPNFDQFPY